MKPPESFSQPNNEEKQEKKELSLNEKFKVLLGLFGTEKARDAFLENCKNYLSARTADTILVNAQDGENYHQKNDPTYSPPQRARTHNMIMETISKLATQIKNPSEKQSAVLRDFYSREEVAKAIKAYFKNENDREYFEDDDEQHIPKKNMSGPAYFHSLGREH